VAHLVHQVNAFLIGVDELREHRPRLVLPHLALVGDMHFKREYRTALRELRVFEIHSELAEESVRGAVEGEHVIRNVHVVVVVRPLRCHLALRAQQRCRRVSRHLCVHFSRLPAGLRFAETL
jgi:hypothetical protein